MTPSTDAVPTVVELRFVPLASIQIEEGANPRRRFDEQVLAELADSIRQHGLLAAARRPHGRQRRLPAHRR